MKKLLINGMLILVFIILIIAVIMALSRLRAVDETESNVNEMMQTQDQALAEEKEIVEQTAVKVNVGNTTSTMATNASKTTATENKNTTTAAKTTSSNDTDVNEFLNSLG